MILATQYLLPSFLWCVLLDSHVTTVCNYLSNVSVKVDNKVLGKSRFRYHKKYFLLLLDYVLTTTIANGLHINVTTCTTRRHDTYKAHAHAHVHTHTHAYTRTPAYVHTHTYARTRVTSFVPKKTQKRTVHKFVTYLLYVSIW